VASCETVLVHVLIVQVCWENTLSALSRGQGAGPNMVKSLDPDAPHRTGKQLHDLDQEDETRLLRCMYGLVRCGLLDEAQELCVRLGQPWRAATLEGWRLFHDPNYEFRGVFMRLHPLHHSPPVSTPQ
jgi:nuclear pore complex protein Nup107